LLFYCAQHDAGHEQLDHAVFLTLKAAEVAFD